MSGIVKNSGISCKALSNSRCYLAGAMDRVVDGGIGWRKTISDILINRFDVTVLNPCNKPISLGREDEKSRAYIQKLKTEGRFDEVGKLLKEVRAIDLRMVDVSDFIILNVDVDVHMCGSYEELTLANRQKKPCIIHVEQGKADCPNWIFGMIPHEHIFSDWTSLVNYLTDIHHNGPNHKRWVLFNYGETHERPSE